MSTALLYVQVYNSSNLSCSIPSTELKLKLVVRRYYFTSMWRYKTIIFNLSKLSLIIVNFC